MLSKFSCRVRPSALGSMPGANKYTYTASAVLTMFMDGNDPRGDDRIPPALPSPTNSSVMDWCSRQSSSNSESGNPVRLLPNIVSTSFRRLRVKRLWGCPPTVQVPSGVGLESAFAELKNGCYGLILLRTWSF